MDPLSAPVYVRNVDVTGIAQSLSELRRTGAATNVSKAQGQEVGFQTCRPQW